MLQRKPYKQLEDKYRLLWEKRGVYIYNLSFMYLANQLCNAAEAQGIKSFNAEQKLQLIFTLISE